MFEDEKLFLRYLSPTIDLFVAIIPIDKRSRRMSDEIDLDKKIEIVYKNHRHEIVFRSIVPVRIYWGQTSYHPKDQWLMEVWDVDKNAERIYALKTVVFLK